MSKFIKASQVKLGDIIMIGDRACKVISIKVSKTGKHGHAKVLINAEDLLYSEQLVQLIDRDDNAGHYAPSQAAWSAE
jgi:translation initiation factor 5A